MIRDIAAIQDYVREIKRDSAVSYWPIWDSMSQAVDQSPGGNQGTYVGTLVQGAGGPFNRGKSALFDGSTGYVQMGTAFASFDVAGDKTVECWAKPTSITSQRGLIDKEYDNSTSDYGGFAMWLSSTGKLWWWNHTGKDIIDTGPLSLVAGRWTHCVIVWNAAAKSASFYYNGLLGGSGSNPGIVERASGSTANLLIGDLRNGLSGGAFRFPGSIAHVALYASALPLGRIAAHYNALANPRVRRVYSIPSGGTVVKVPWQLLNMRAA